MNNKEDVTTDFLHNGSIINDTIQNANNINNYYSKIGLETNESVQPSKYPSNHYLHKHMKRNEHSILLSEVTMEEVVDVCKNLSPKASSDASGFQQKIVLQDAGILAPVLTHLINCSLNAGVCPDNSKLAKVIPVYKLKGCKQLYENYRPISLLSAFSKIMEKLI